MKVKEFVKVDGKGRITIPTSIRLALGIKEGMIVMLVADLDRRTLMIIPTKVDETQRIIRLLAVIRDKPGALANLLLKIRETLPEFDAISTNCINVIRGETAKCEILATIPVNVIETEKFKELTSMLKQQLDVVSAEIVVLE